MCAANGGADHLDIEILPDGRIKVITGAVGSAVHTQAADFFKVLGDLLGEPVTRTRRVDVQAAISVHEHSHDSGGHSHE